jgi:L-2-hydroxyglutarate oxidase LhgO
MTSSQLCDFLVIGGGVVGLSVAIELKSIDPSLSVVLIEKESNLGMHASGRNSGVIHAGFYYSPDSLKARFCVEGNIELRKLIRDYGLTILETGKVVLAKNDQEVEVLENLATRGEKNSVRIELHDSQSLSSYEPLAKTHKKFLWSPDTAVAKPLEIIRALEDKAIKRGVKIERGIIATNFAGEFNGWLPKHLVNCAGSQADRIAKSYGFGANFEMLPFLGRYKKIPWISLPLKTQVYPVPNTRNPFLGVHFTKTADGFVKIGPTAIPVFNREQYHFMQNWKVKDLTSSLRAGFSILKGHKHDPSSIFAEEFLRIVPRIMRMDAEKLIPSFKDLNDWTSSIPGIRSQIVDTRTGELVSDFLIEGDKDSTHVLNAVSPGWTSSIPFGAYVARIAARRG